MIPSAPEEARTELINALSTWGWSNYFPPDWDTANLPIGVQITTEFPSDQLQNIERTANGMLTKPVISVIDLPLRESPGRRALGNVIGPGATTGTLRYGQKLQIPFQVDCWADLQTGGGDQAQRIGGGVIDCLFVNRNALSAYRRLEVSGGRLTFVDAASLWRLTCTVTGLAVQSYDQ